MMVSVCGVIGWGGERMSRFTFDFNEISTERLLAHARSHFHLATICHSSRAQMNNLSHSYGDQSMPLVSVVIPAFNAATTIDATIESVLNQTYKNIEIIVVNDGSTDRTATVLRKYSSRIQLVHQSNRGLAKARNTGAGMASGDFVCLLDADDLCLPERVALQVEALELFPDAVLCCSDFSAFNSMGHVADSHASNYYSVIANSPGGLTTLFSSSAILGDSPRFGLNEKVSLLYGHVYRQLFLGNFIHPPTVMIRRKFLVQVGGFDESIKYNSDWECFVRLARLGSFLYVCHPLLAYRLSDNQMSRNNRGRGQLDLVMASEKIWKSDEKLARELGDRFREVKASFYGDAASALVEHDKYAALKMLAGRVRCMRPDSQSVMTAIKMLLPGNVLAWLRETLNKSPRRLS
jgi:glycosyltransferase involved in cell wall biosynthesis